MNKKILILYFPVIHRGYLEFLDKIRGKVSFIYIIEGKFLEELSEIKPDIAAIEAKTMKNLLNKLGFENVLILSKENIYELKDKELILIEDEISRNLGDKYLKGEKKEWHSVFLRWDKDKILSEQPLKDIPVSNNSFDLEMMKEAYKEAEKSSDWWRRIGAVLVKEKKILFRSRNQDLPGDHTPYQVGEVRDFFKPGEKQELASTIHAEQKIISQAAKNGVSLKGTSLYATTFPCPVCAKLIVCSGIKNLYFSQGGANFDAKKILDSFNVKITCVPLKSV